MWGDPQAAVDHVVIDSRQADEGALFVPIIGERVDAHRFIPDVLEQGAACTFSSQDSVTGTKGACIYVSDTKKALQDLAAWYRSGFDIPVIGITGSVGKTTTKEMIAAVLESKYRTVKTLGNLNSQIGVALMMFHLEEETEVAVFEMGISMPGEMDRLVEIARPQMAVMTNIGVSHIGNLGSRENICREKGKIIKKFQEEGILYVCADNGLKDFSAANIPYEVCEGNCRTIYYGIEGDWEYTAQKIQTTAEGQTFDFVYPDGRESFSLAVMGAHNVNNAIVALAIGHSLGVSLQDAKKALADYRPIAMRGVVKETRGAHLIDDTYNASPDSIKSNLKALFDHSQADRHIAVLGDVLELGERSYELHEGIGHFIIEEAKKGNALSVLVTVGTQTRAIHESVQKFCATQTKEEIDIECIHCDETAQATQILRENMRQGDWILIKGSRGMRMDKIVEDLTKE